MPKYIEYEALIQQIEPYLTWELLAEINKLADEVNALEALQRTDECWISVEEALPEKVGKYLVYDDVKGVTIAFYAGEHRFEQFLGLPCATHWLPLPAPPEIEEDEA